MYSVQRLDRSASHRLLILAIVFLSAALAAAQAPSVVGDWSTTLDVDGAPIPLTIHIEPSNATALTGHINSRTMGLMAVPLCTVSFSGGKLNLSVAGGQGSFNGKLSPDGQSITGFWYQKNTQSLTLHRVAASATGPNRPQTPKPPFPYRAEDVTYTSGDVTIAATLTIPEGPGPFPAVLLISGSGPHDRDESLLGHKPFLVLADDLSRHGIAVLRADKRGIGKSSGDAKTATLEDYAADAQAGVAFLRTRTEVDRRRMGLLGHSEGGDVAPMVAARAPNDIAFIVLLAAPGLPGKDIVIAQTKLVAVASGVPVPVAERSQEQEEELLDAVVAEPNSAGLHLKLFNLMKEDGVPDARIPASIDVLTSTPYRFFLTHDPAPALRQVRCPVLALDGSKDVQVPPAQDLAAIRAALEAGGNTHVTTEELPGLNHLFQTAKTGAPGEYAQIEETMAPIVMHKVVDWILAQPPLPQVAP